MAPIASDVDLAKTNQMKRRDDADEKDNLWSSILGEVQARGNTKLPSNKSVLVLGDNGSGKTTLVAKLQGVESPTKGSGLEYAYIDVRDEYRDDSTRLGVWVMDGDPGLSPLMRFALSEENYPHTLVMLVVSMSNPCGLLDQLQFWSNRLHDHLRSLNINPDLERDCRHRCVKKWQEYVESIDDNIKRTSRSLDEGELIPLEENILSVNYGLDMVVVVTKTDYMLTLEKEYDYREETFDFIQYHIRNFCLRHGAALFYTSAKEDKNCDLLYKYLTHRIYGFAPVPPALVVEKDAVLVPAGWDLTKKIAILTESMHNVKPDSSYREVITAPHGIRKSLQKEAEVTAEEDQNFLTRLLQQLQAGRTEGAQKPPERRSVGAPGTPGSLAANKKLDGKAIGPGGSSEGVLANFFNSLLAKKAPTLSGSPVKTDNGGDISVRVDAAAELERLARTSTTTDVSDAVESNSEC